MTTTAPPRHPRRDAIAEAAYKALVSDRAARERIHVTRWGLLRDHEQEMWRDQADQWAYVVALDARAEVQRMREEADRAAAPASMFDRARTTFYAPPADPDSQWFRRDDAHRASTTGLVAFKPRDSFLDDFDPPRNRTPSYAHRAYGVRFWFHRDGTVSKHFARQPAPPLAIEQGSATDTRRTTHHTWQMDPTETGILRRSLYTFTLTTYPLAGHGLPAGETTCTCPEPTPLAYYRPNAHGLRLPTPPADAWLRCDTCRGLYTRT